MANIELGRQRPTLHTLWAIAAALEFDARALLPEPDEVDDAAIDKVKQLKKPAKRVAAVSPKSAEKVESFIATSKGS